MTEHLQIAQQTLLEPTGLDISSIQQTLDQAMLKKVDLADVYFQFSQSESWSLEDSIIKSGSYQIDQGVGIRAIHGEKTGFAYSDEIQLPALLQAAKTAGSIANKGNDHTIKTWDKPVIKPRYQAVQPLNSLSEDDKIALLNAIDIEARQQSTKVTQVIAGLTASYSVILIANSEGRYAADVRPLVRLNVSVVVEEKDKRETGSHGAGARVGYAWLQENDQHLEITREAVRRALVSLEAENAPAGTMPVVLGKGWPGIMLHEAVGHGLEGDFNRKGTSAFSGKIGQAVASSLCTVVDDGTLNDRRGSLNIDDEGTPAQYNVLIEKGILQGYMQDLHNAGLMKTQATGNGRRESYRHRPMPRMTNTYMLPGDHSPEEIISSVDKGIYAVNFSGGQVDITSGKFVFNMNEAYLIEKGKVTRPIKGATMIGNGPEVMHNISMLGNDLELDSGVGTCGKNGQSVPVGVGQPTLKIDQITVGGTG